MTQIFDNTNLSENALLVNNDTPINPALIRKSKKDANFGQNIFRLFNAQYGVEDMFSANNGLNRKGDTDAKLQEQEQKKLRQNQGNQNFDQSTRLSELETRHSEAVYKQDNVLFDLRNPAKMPKAMLFDKENTLRNLQNMENDLYSRWMELLQQKLSRVFRAG